MVEKNADEYQRGWFEAMAQKRILEQWYILILVFNSIGLKGIAIDGIKRIIHTLRFSSCTTK